jgi:hypothetical protein
MVETEKFTFIGWSFKEWARRNKDNFKALAILLAGYNYVSGFSLESFIAGVSVIAGKFVVDTIDYWLKE